MADEPIARLSVDVVANLKVQKAEIDKFANDVSKGISQGLKGAEGTKSATAAFKEFAASLRETQKWLIGTPIKSAFQKMFKNIGEATKKVKGFLSAVGRIAIYRAIRWALKEITQGFQEGIQNAYQWSVVTGNQFAKSMDMMATSALYLKNSLGAMTMPLINVLAPILDRLVDRFVDLINVVNQFIATITGASSWTKALKYPKQFAEATGGALREIKNQLLGFDELNILNAPNGGGGAMGLDYESMFEQMELSISEFSLVKQLRDAIMSDDWNSVGRLISDKLNNMITSVNWQQVGNRLGEFVKGTFHRLSDFIRGVDWQMIAYNTTTSLFNFITSIDWGGIVSAVWDSFKAVVQALISGLSGLLGGLGGSLVNWVYDLLDKLNVFLAKLRNESATTYVPASHPHSSTGEYYNYGNQGNAITGSGNSHEHGAVFDGGFANGGFPRRGTMFYAGESGAEFVGNIGGRTGVYNADQMTVALANANEGVVDALASVGNAIVRAINNKDMSINVNDVRVALKNSQLRYGA